MAVAVKSHKSSHPRSWKPPFFLDDLAFAVVARPEERKKIREKRHERSRGSAFREMTRHRRHRAEVKQDGKEAGEVEEVEVVEDTSMMESMARRYKDRRGAFSWDNPEPMADVDGFSSDGEAESSEKPLVSQLGGRIGNRHESSWTRACKGNSDSNWDKAQEGFSGRSYTAGGRSRTDEDFDSFTDALRKVSLKDGRDANGKRAEGSWSREAHGGEKPSRRHRSESSRPENPAHKGGSLPGGWPSSSARFQTGSLGAPPPRERESRPIEEIFRTGMSGYAPRRRVRRPKDAGRREERARKRRPSPPAPILQFPNPNTIAPRRQKKVGSGNRHLRPGMPLTEENIVQHTIAAGGQKSFGDKSKGWKGCTPGGESEGSEGSLWGGWVGGELEPWDSLSCNDYGY